MPRNKEIANDSEFFHDDVNGMKIDAGCASKGLRGQWEYSQSPLCLAISCRAIEIHGGNSRRSERKAYESTYLDILEKKLGPLLKESVPEAKIERTDAYGFLQIGHGDCFTHQKPPERKQVEYLELWFQQHVSKLEEVFKKAHAAVIAEIGLPEIHGTDGKLTGVHAARLTGQQGGGYMPDM
jgi:hypothetical protein